VKESGHTVSSSAARFTDEGNEWRFNVHWQGTQQASPPRFIEQLAGLQGVKEVRWTPTLRA
jgi:hypothetical protein